jgi:hypothetical protein
MRFIPSLASPYNREYRGSRGQNKSLNALLLTNTLVLITIVIFSLLPGAVAQDHPVPSASEQPKPVAPIVFIWVGPHADRGLPMHCPDGVQAYRANKTHALMICINKEGFVVYPIPDNYNGNNYPSWAPLFGTRVLPDAVPSLTLIRWGQRELPRDPKLMEYCKKHIERTAGQVVPNASAAFMLAEVDDRSGEFLNAFCWENKLLELGDWRAGAVIALDYVNGHGVAANPEWGFQYAMAAADAGDFRSMYILTHFLADGIGTPVDLNQSLLWEDRLFITDEGAHFVDVAEGRVTSNGVTVADILKDLDDASKVKYNKSSPLNARYCSLNPDNCE